MYNLRAGKGVWHSNGVSMDAQETSTNLVYDLLNVMSKCTTEAFWRGKQTTLVRYTPYHSDRATDVDSFSFSFSSSYTREPALQSSSERAGQWTCSQRSTPEEPRSTEHQAA